MTQITSNEQQNIEVPKQQVTHNTDCILQYLNAHTPIPFMYFYEVSRISSISLGLSLSLSLSLLSLRSVIVIEMGIPSAFQTEM